MTEATSKTVWACTGKVRFEDMGLARRIARERHKGGPGARRKQNKPGAAYRCPVCGGIHIGRSYAKKVKGRWVGE